MHKAQGFPTGPTHAALGHPEWPMAGDCSQLLSSQRQRVPSQLLSIQQVPICVQSNLQVSPVPFPKSTRAYHTIQTCPTAFTLTTALSLLLTNSCNFPSISIWTTSCSPHSPHPMALLSSRSKWLASAPIKMLEHHWGPPTGPVVHPHWPKDAFA